MGTAVIRLQCNLSYRDCRKVRYWRVCQETLFCVTQLCSIFCFRYNEISGLLGSLPGLWHADEEDTMQRVV